MLLTGTLFAPAYADSGATLTGLIIAAIIIIITLILIFGMKASEAKTRSAAAAVSLTPDDLKIIEGIGPKIAKILSEAGITTFADLAKADPAKLNQILDTAGIGNIADPATWPQQAKLAAEGKMDELQALQDSLKGGRKE